MRWLLATIYVRSDLFLSCCFSDALLAGEKFPRSLELESDLLVRCPAVGVAIPDAGLGTDGVFDIGAEERRKRLELLERHILEVFPRFDALMDGLAGDGVCLAERHAFLHEVVREVGGVGEVLGHGLCG